MTPEDEARVRQIVREEITKALKLHLQQDAPQIANAVARELHRSSGLQSVLDGLR